MKEDLKFNKTNQLCAGLKHELWSRGAGVQTLSCSVLELCEPRVLQIWDYDPGATLQIVVRNKCSNVCLWWQVHDKPIIYLKIKKQTFTPKKHLSNFFGPSWLSDTVRDRKILSSSLQSWQEGQEASGVTALVTLCNGERTLGHWRMGEKQEVSEAWQLKKSPRVGSERKWGVSSSADWVVFL